MSEQEWYQMVLTPPDVVEVRIRVGLVPETDHAQVMVEMFDPVTKVQMAQASVPHERLANYPALLAWAVGKVLDWISEQIEPF